MLDYIKKLITPDMVSLWVPSGLNRAQDLIRGNHGQCYGTHPNVPVISEVKKEVLVDGGFETWATVTNLPHWTENLAGTSAVDRDGEEEVEGVYCCRLDVDASNSVVQIRQQFSTKPLTKHKVIVWYKNSVADKTGYLSIRDESFTNVFLDSNAVWQTGATNITLPNSTTWTKYELEFYPHEDYSVYHVILSRSSAASSSIYFDDVRIQELRSSTINTSVGWHFVTDDYIEVPDDNSLDVTDEWTLGAWLYLRTLASAPDVFAKGTTGLFEPLRLNIGSNSINTQIADASDNRDFVYSTAGYGIPEYSWTYFEFAFNSGATVFYRNGVLRGTDTSLITSLYASTGSLFIGARKSGANHFDGYIALPFIANKARSLAHVKNFYNATKGMFSPRS